MRKPNKKGQIIQQMGAIGIGIAILAILLVVVFLINAKVKTQVLNDQTATSFGEISYALTNATATAVTHCVPESTMSVTDVKNSSAAGGISLLPATYTVAGNNITLTVTNTSLGATQNITFSCDVATLAYNSSNTLNSDTYSMVGWIGLVVIILIGIIILGLIRRIRQ
jgi:hypothetical protein